MGAAGAKCGDTSQFQELDAVKNTRVNLCVHTYVDRHAASRVSFTWLTPQ